MSEKYLPDDQKYRCCDECGVPDCVEIMRLDSGEWSGCVDDFCIHCDRGEEWKIHGSREDKTFYEGPPPWLTAEGYNPPGAVSGISNVVRMYRGDEIIDLCGFCADGSRAFREYQKQLEASGQASLLGEDCG